jgi:hypothetical protein
MNIKNHKKQKLKKKTKEHKNLNIKAPQGTTKVISLCLVEKHKLPCPLKLEQPLHLIYTTMYFSSSVLHTQFRFTPIFDFYVKFTRLV